MKSPRLLFNEQTILNLPFIVKLSSRYWGIILVVFLIVLSSMSYKFYFQNPIYSSDKRFRVDSDGSENKGGVVSELLSGSLRRSAVVDFSAIAESSSFHDFFARQILDHPDFERFDLRKLNEHTDEHYLGEIASCHNDNHCIRSFVARRAADMISIFPEAGRRHTFVFRVRSTDSFTSRTLVDLGANSLVEYRLSALKEFIQMQRQTVSSVLSEFRDVLEAEDFRGLNQRLLEVDKMEEDARMKIRQLFPIYQRKAMELESVRRSHDTFQASELPLNDFNYLQKVDRAEKLKNSIARLKKDIETLNLSSGVGNQADQQIILTLQQELEVKKQAFSRKYSDLDLLASTTTLRGSRNISDIYQSTLDEYKQIKTQYDNHLNMIQSLNTERRIIQQRLEDLNSKGKLVLSLEERKLQSDIAANTVTPDVIFYDSTPSHSRFIRMSPVKYILYTSVLSIFFSFILVCLRYLFDPTIYDEEELQESFSHIPILGSTPNLKKAS